MADEPTKQKLARHEAAHFVVDWAVGQPKYPVDITSAAQKICGNNPNMMILGQTYGDQGSSPFENILGLLAGPVADYWGHDNSYLLKGDKNIIDRTLSSIAERVPLDVDDGDWDACLRSMVHYGINVLDKKTLDVALPLFLDAVRSLLKLCEKEWQEATEHLVRYGGIGYYGAHNPPPPDMPPVSPDFKDRPLPDSGEEASMFFTRWGDDWEEPPEAVKSCIEKSRATIQAAGIRQEVEWVSVDPSANVGKEPL